MIDKYELYSFSLYLYFYGFFYSYILNESIIKGFITNICGNLFLYYLFNNNIITFIKHKYWKENLTDIVIPQLTSCITNITLIKKFKNPMIILPINTLTYFFILNIYKNEITYSKNLRFIINILFFIYHFF